MIEYEEWLIRLGDVLKMIRKKKKLTQTQTADLAEINYSFYRSVEYGKRPVSSRTLWKICEALDTSMRDVVSMAG
tara:strand:+ start:1605 stop:1829 length:225 start_codon:yes stop_codon:yes gene_type:complete